MCRRNWLAAVVCVGMLTGSAQGQVKLEWKFKEGEKFSLEVVMSSKETVTPTNKPATKQDLQLTFNLDYRVYKKYQNGAVDLVQTIKSIKAEGTGDLTSLNKFCQLFAGTEIELSLSPKMVLTRFKGYDDAINRIAQGDAFVAGSITELLPAENLKTIIRETFAPLPDKPVTVNQKWGGTFLIPLGDFGKLDGITDYTYIGEMEGREKISVEARVTKYTPPTRNDLNVVKGQPVKSENIKGTIFFDKTLGMLSESDMSMTIKGHFRVPGPMGREMVVQMSQDRSIKLKLLRK